MRKLISALLAVVMLVSGASLVSCKTSADDIKVTLVIQAGDEVVANYNVTVDSEDATVINVVQEAMAQYNIDVALDSKGESLNRAGNYNTCTKKFDDKDCRFYWLYTLNGTEPQGGNASTVAVANGDKIEYRFVYAYSEDGGKAVTEDYSSDMALFGEEPDVLDETEAEEEA